MWANQVGSNITSKPLYPGLLSDAQRARESMRFVSLAAKGDEAAELRNLSAQKQEEKQQ